MQNQERAGAAGTCVAARGTKGGWHVLRWLVAIFVFVTVSIGLSKPTHAQNSLTTKLQAARSSPEDLELGGDLKDLPPNTTRYLTREDLLALPQVSFTVTNDANFSGATQITGVSLEELTRQLAAAPRSDLAIAICDDKYRANYSRTYVESHHPVLVLKINGQLPSGWPKDPEGQNLEMGPYLISHPNFTPSFKVAGRRDEPQIPWGVVRLEFRDETSVFGAIAPSGPQAHDEQVQGGYGIARQNCFRCHNMGDQGGQKAGHPWLVLSAWATASPDYFAAYIHNPKDKNPRSEMPAFPEYDAAALRTLIAYFQTFTAREKP